MQKSQFTDEQIVAILQQAEKGEKPVAEVCRQHNILITFAGCLAELWGKA